MVADWAAVAVNVGLTVTVTVVVALQCPGAADASVTVRV
jgi:hypothetical protein